jgi:hypothetical protein
VWNSKSALLLAAVAACLAPACGDSSGDADAAPVPDTGTPDAAVSDTADAAVPDTADAAVPDTADAAVPDTADAAVPDTGTPDAATGRPIVAGERVGAVALGMTWAEVRAALGAPMVPPIVLTRVGYVMWPQLGVEALFTSPLEMALADDAIVIGVAATAPADFAGAARPGLTRAAVEAALGAPAESYGGRAYYAAGLAVEYTAEVASKVAVVASYALAPTPPPMTPAPPRAEVERQLAGRRQPAHRRGVIIGDRTIPVIDMHLHAGEYGAMSASGKAFVTAGLPPFLLPYAPALLDRLSDPYAPHIGIAAQTALAEVGNAVLYAVYTPGTTGYFTNEQLAAALLDARNVATGGGPWAWGLASLDFDGWTDDLAGERLAALRSYLATYPELFVGIKLAHAHQGVRFDDAEYQGVYQVAADTGAPVLLHTGLSPFPGTRDDPAYYDPQNLEAIVTTFDGTQGAGRVDFVLSHVGQGDARAVAHALDLAAAHDNVWLELSALGRPLLVDADGAPTSGGDPQYPAVLAAIRDRGLIGRALFASDGPQFSGAVRTYLGRIVQGMQDAGYSVDEIEQVLSGNFRRLFLREGVGRR